MVIHNQMKAYSHCLLFPSVSFSGICTLILTLLQFLSVTHSADIQIHTLRNGSIELNGEVPNVHVVSVLWTLNKDKVVEWEMEDEMTIYYPRFYKTNLNMDTWALTISDLQPTFNGRYALEINGGETAKSYQLIVLEPVSSPDISYGCDPEGCTLTCKGADSDHTEYSWTDNRGGNEKGSVLKVEKTEELDGVYTCNFSNPVSWKTSSISERELFPPDATDTGPDKWPIIGGVALIIIVLGITIYMYIKMKGEAHVRPEQPEAIPLSTTNSILSDQTQEIRG